MQRKYERAIVNGKTYHKLLVRAEKDGSSSMSKELLARKKQEARNYYLTMNEKYKAFCSDNKRAYYPWRTQTMLSREDELLDKQNVISSEKELQKEEKNDIISINKGGLVNVKTGKVVETQIRKVDPKSLKGFNKKTGWNVDWTSLGLKVEVYAITVKDDKRLQGLVGFEKKEDYQSMYVNWMSTAPQNNKLLNNGEKEYDGVGSMLIAKAVEESIKAGYDGHMHGIANTSKTLDYYVKIGERGK